ncbi:MFS transporter [Terrabacter sp. MAHUQ-38]|uniref:MFS transporter n=1 Tax=unclassified Terrabacter TaxID=2630222 RepID=UPI00165EB8A3|nr:MFS transporter [Terrabacter sp. MAHUQ-38]MBC9819817.1 MFS transporter [Terrabacter sp. MAHUQ-38]
MSSPAAGVSSLWTPDFIRVTVMDLAYFLAAGILIYALPLYAVGPVGADERGAGVAFGAFTITALLLRPYAGRLTDRLGRRPLMVAGALLAAALTLCFLLTSSIAAVIAVRLASGVAEAAFFVAGFAMLADLAPQGRQGEALSLNSIALYLGIALGPIAAERLIDLSGFAAAFWAAGLLCLVAAALAWMTTEPPREDDGPGTGGLGAAPAQLIHRRTLAPSVGFIGGLLASSGFMAFCSIRAGEVGTATPSLVLMTYGATVIGVRLTLATIADRVPALRVLAAGLAVLCSGALVAALAGGPALLVAAAAVIGLGVGLLTPAFFATVFADVAPSQRGAAAGTASMAIDLGLGIGPILLGLVAAPLGIPAAFVVGAAAAGLGAVWTVGLMARRAAAVGRLPAGSAD